MYKRQALLLEIDRLKEIILSFDKENGRIRRDLRTLHKLNENLKQELQELRDGGSSTGGTFVPERYQDEVDESDAPLKNPTQGDLTPDYVKWAREGGMTREVFHRRYRGRIKDLSHSEDPSTEG